MYRLNIFSSSEARQSVRKCKRKNVNILSTMHDQSIPWVDNQSIDTEIVAVDRNGIKFTESGVTLLVITIFSDFVIGFTRSSQSKGLKENAHQNITLTYF